MTGHGDTIFALASGRGTAGIAVIRISGPRAGAALAALAGPELPAPREAALRDFRDEDGRLVDRGLALRFEAGASFTGEPVAELHCHGGRAVVAALLEALGRQAGCRMAEPGEFTRRAFEAGRLDLAGVEALGDLLAAETELQRRQAARGLAGELHRQAAAWREALLRAAALVEVTIDWVDEEVPEDTGPEVAQLVGGVRDGILRELALSSGAERLREGFEVAILGAPNAGKSSLFNALARREAAIVSDLPGTTRDVLELRYDLGGLPVVFLDTAGLRDSADEVEAIGVGRARARAEGAALRLFLRAPDVPDRGAADGLWRPGDLRVWSKADLGGPDQHGETSGAAIDLAVSAREARGLEALLERIRRGLEGQVSEAGLVGHLRQRRALEAAAGALARAADRVETGEAETVAEEIRAAFRALDRLLGRVGVEEVLDAVFSAFCLGK